MEKKSCPKCQTAFDHCDDRLVEIGSLLTRYSTQAFAKVCLKCYWAWQAFQAKTEEHQVLSRISAEELAIPICYSGFSNDVDRVTDRLEKLSRERREATVSLRDRCLVWLGSSTDDE